MDNTWFWMQVSLIHLDQHRSVFQIWDLVFWIFPKPVRKQYIFQHGYCDEGAVSAPNMGVMSYR